MRRLAVFLKLSASPASRASSTTARSTSRRPPRTGDGDPAECRRRDRRPAALTGEGREQLRELLLAATTDVSAFGLLGILGVVWAASGMVAATRKAVNLAWETEPRSLVRGKALDVLVVLGAGLLVLLSLALSLIFRLAERAASWLLDAFGPAAAVASWLLGVGLPTLLGFAVILFAYRVLPAFDPPLPQILPPAVLAAAAIALLQQGFVLYVRHFGRYDMIYGSIGTVIAFLLFVYLAAAVFLFGVHLARRWPDALERSRPGTA